MKKVSIHKYLYINRNFFLLTQGQFVSGFGTHFFDLARLYWIASWSNSSLGNGVILALCSLTYIVSNSFAGLFSDRFSRKGILVISDFFSGMVMFILVILFLNHSIAMNQKIGLLIILSMCISFSSAFFDSAVFALIPDLVEIKELKHANSLYNFAKESAQILGQACGGMLYALCGVHSLFFFNGISFIFSGITECFIQINRKLTPNTGAFKQEPKPKVLLRVGYRYVLNHIQLLQVILFNMLQNFFLMPIFVLSPFLAKSYPGGGSGTYGFLLSAFAMGLIIGIMFIGTFSATKKQRKLINLLLIFLMPVAIMLIGFFTSPTLGIVLYVLLGVSWGYNNVLISTVLQRITENEMRGRVGGIAGLLSNILTPVGFLISGIIGAYFVNNILILYRGLGVIFLTFMIILWNSFKQLKSIFIIENLPQIPD